MSVIKMKSISVVTSNPVPPKKLLPTGQYGVKVYNREKYITVNGKDININKLLAYILSQGDNQNRCNLVSLEVGRWYSEPNGMLEYLNDIEYITYNSSTRELSYTWVSKGWSYYGSEYPISASAYCPSKPTTVYEDLTFI